MYGTRPDIIIIDDIVEEGTLSAALWDALLDRVDVPLQLFEMKAGPRRHYISPDPVQPLLDEPMVKKNGKLVRRHHPIPTTPRSPRGRR